MLWTDKYSPKTTKEIVGQDQAMNYLKSFVVNFKKCKKKAVMLHGPTGSGKTSSVYALAKEF